MKKYPCYLKRISTLSIFLLFGCSMLTIYRPSKQTLELDSRNVKDVESVRSQYCSGSKAIKEIKFTFTLVDPKMAPAISTSRASNFLTALEDQRQCFYKSILYSLSKSGSWPDISLREVGEDLFKQLEAEGLGNINPNNLASNCRMKTLFIQSPSQKIRAYQASACSNGNGSSWFSGTEIKLNSSNSYDLRLPHLSNLIDSYTFVEPKEYQDTAYDCTKNSYICSCPESYTYKDENLGYNSSGEFDSDLALQYKNEMWKRYIARFTTVKVNLNSNSNHPNESDVEVSLDLSGFCRYGRNVSDLTTK